MKSMAVVAGLVLGVTQLQALPIYTTTPYYPAFTALSDYQAFPGLAVTRIKLMNMNRGLCDTLAPTCIEISNFGPGNSAEIDVSGQPWAPFTVIQQITIDHHGRSFDKDGNILTDQMSIAINWLRSYDPAAPVYHHLELMPAAGWLNIVLVSPGLYRAEGELTVNPALIYPMSERYFDPVTLYTGTPEPTGAWLLGIALVAIGALHRRTRQTA
ncbi:MAG: hypothetical protein NTV70_10110 [Acidobacteria bacterium]|nr:hypothetical protein [Acidobacteriota bacterium]